VFSGFDASLSQNCQEPIEDPFLSSILLKYDWFSALEGRPRSVDLLHSSVASDRLLKMGGGSSSGIGSSDLGLG
jgi:hypothetical protein